MFMRFQKRTGADGAIRYYASLVRGDRIKGKLVQTTIANLGVVEEDQIPFLKAAYAKEKPRLVWEDGSEYCWEEKDGRKSS